MHDRSPGDRGQPKAAISSPDRLIHTRRQDRKISRDRRFSASSSAAASPGAPLRSSGLCGTQKPSPTHAPSRESRLAAKCFHDPRVPRWTTAHGDEGATPSVAAAWPQLSGSRRVATEGETTGPSRMEQSVERWRRAATARPGQEPARGESRPLLLRHDLDRRGQTRRAIGSPGASVRTGAVSAVRPPAALHR